MNGKTKRPKHVATRLRGVLAANVSKRMEARYRDAGDRTKALAESAGVSQSTVQRVLNPDRYSNGATIDTVDMLAMALRCEPFELLLDDHVSR